MFSKREQKILYGGIGLLMIITIIGLAYAAFTGQLRVTGGSGVSRTSKWDVHFSNLSSITTEHSAKVLTEPTLTDATTIEDYSVSITGPGDTISFTVDVVNEGNYNAQITSINIGTPTCTGIDSTSNTNVCNHLHYSLTYDNGSTVQVNDILYAKETNTLKVTLNYDSNVTASELPTSEVSLSNLDITINFQQSSDALVKDNGEVADYKVYKQGDKITLNNEDYWVIAKSGADKDYVVALKELPLTANEIISAGGTTSTTGNNIGLMEYDTSSNEYTTSDIKSVIDSWATSKFINSELKEVDGYSVRLITKTEYEAILGTNSWRYNSQYEYWTISPYSSSRLWRVTNDGSLYSGGNVTDIFAVRPVINVYKSALETKND